jgi:hypothetical protein
MNDKEIVLVEQIRMEIEKAVVDHCTGGDLYMTTYLAAKEVLRILDKYKGVDCG